MNNNLILIPARSGTTNISRQNLRFIGNKPLIYYVIKTALKYTKNVYVSTDSNEIREISKLFGAKVILRPKILTKDSTKLEDIVHHALSKISKGKDFEKCLILNPKYPLIEYSTIKEFFTELDKKAQTVFGFAFNPQHQYKKIQFNDNHSGKIVDNLKNCVITEKIVSFKINKFLRERKFPSPFYGLKLSDNEPLALESYHDFGILEKILNRKRILVRVDGSQTIGLGHVHNMLTILNHFRNEEILVVMNNSAKLGNKKFKEYLYDVKLFKTNNEFLKIVKQFKPDMIFNDILNTDRTYMEKIKKSEAFIVNFEDLGTGRKNADLVFNPIFYSKTKSSNEYYGPNFACVREEFRLWEPIKIKKHIEKITIIFGGIDPTNKTNQILKILQKFQLKNFTYSIVIGQDYKNKKELLEQISKMKDEKFKIILNDNVDLLSKIFHESDFAITSNGRTVFELGSLYVPMIVIPVNKRENTHNFVEKYNTGYILKNLNESTSKEFHNIFKSMLKYQNRQKFHENLGKINLLYGVDRVVNKINSVYEQKKKI
tara:strand:+ start:1798 stop:3429 length:1632 start_codon:yes stop_codon:yes gene_type:complete